MFHIEAVITRTYLDDGDLIPTSTGPQPRAVTSKKWEAVGRGATVEEAFAAAQKNGLAVALEELGK
jgi:hypothetical protein